MFYNFCSFWKKPSLYFLLLLIVLCGCSLAGTSQATPPVPIAATQTAFVVSQTVLASSLTPIPATQTAFASRTVLASSQTTTPTTFASYVGKWTVHGAVMVINADYTGLVQWNAGPCGGTMCGGTKHDTFTLNADGSIKGTTQSVSYNQSNGSPVPTDFSTDPSEPQVGDTFLLQHSGAHLLYTTWLGRVSYLNNGEGNRYWCDAYALSAGSKQCGA